MPLEWKGFNPLKCFCCCVRLPQRFVVALLLHLALENSYSIRIVLNVAIVAMVEPAMQSNKTEVACPMFHYEPKIRKGGLYQWPRVAEARILYAFYLGYFFSNVPTGYLSDEFGSRHVMGISLIIGVIVTIIFPISVQKGGQWAAVGLRFLLGLSQGAVLPCISTMVSKWIPQKQQALLGAIAYSGSSLGSTISAALTGVIIEQTQSWPMAFYIWGGVGAVYLVLHYMCFFSVPQTHPFITQEELDYLTKEIAVKKRKKIPWKGILTNVPYWACVAGHFGHNYIFYSLVTFMPTYMREILRYDIQTNALFSALPFVSLWVCSILFGALAHFVINKGIISRQLFGQIFGSLGQWGSASAALLAAYVGCNRELVIVLFVVALGLKAFYYMTMTVNINILSSNYAGILFAICNGICALTGVIGNGIIGAVTKHGKLSEWRLAFWITFGVAVLTSIIYIIWTSDERQAFDYEEDDEVPNE